MSTHFDTTKRRLFELRFDTPLPGGSIADLVPKPPLKPAHIWSTVAGRLGQSVISLYHWETLTKWREVVSQIKDPVDAYTTESWIMVDSPAFASAAAAKGKVARPLHELRIQRVLNNTVPEASAALMDLELNPAVERGAEAIGLYELSIGPDRPVIVTMLAWPDSATAHQAWSEIDGMDATASNRDSERSTYRRRMIQGLERYLMRPLEISAK